MWPLTMFQDCSACSKQMFPYSPLTMAQSHLKGFFSSVLIIGNGGRDLQLEQRGESSLSIQSLEFSPVCILKQPGYPCSWSMLSTLPLRFQRIAACTVEFYSHTITECFGSEVTSKIIQFQPRCNGQGHIPVDQVAQDPSTLALKTPRNGTSPTSLSNVSQSDYRHGNI